MALAGSPNIVTNGLVFAYDMNSRRSYKGPPLQNKLSSLSATAGTGTGYVLTAGSEIVNIPTLGDTPVTVCNLQNTGASWCCVNFMNFGNTGNILSGSTLYTYLLLYRVDSGYTGGNFMYRYEYNSSGTYQGEAGVFDDARRTYLGNGWYYAWGTFTTQPATTNITGYSFSYNYSNYTDKYSWAKVAIVQGDYSGMHPSLWPALGTTQTTTTNLIDLTTRSTATAGGLSYNSDGTFNFVYSNPSYVQVPLSTAFNKTEGTMNFWVYPTRYNGGNGYFVNREDATPNAADWFWIGPYSDTFYFRIGDGSTCCNNDLSFGSVSTNIPLNTWTNMCFTWQINGTSMIYKNGVQFTSRTIGNIPTTNPASNGRIGLGHVNADNYYDGKMPTVQIYNRQLSASEVAQNFNAMRGRYGV